MIVLRRIAGAADAALCGQIYFDAVRGATGGAYSAAALAAWVPEVPVGPDWSHRFREGSGFVAQRDGKPVGFMLITPSGHIDLAFVLPRERGRGTAGRLYDAIIQDVAPDVPLSTFASAFFRPFLERRGWVVTETQHVERHGQTLTRYAMTLDRAQTPLT